MGIKALVKKHATFARVQILADAVWQRASQLCRLKARFFPELLVAPLVGLVLFDALLQRVALLWHFPLYDLPILAVVVLHAARSSLF